jgi:hypothetical protein
MNVGAGFQTHAIDGWVETQLTPASPSAAAEAKPGTRRRDAQRGEVMQANRLDRECVITDMLISLHRATGLEFFPCPIHADQNGDACVGYLP